MDSTEIDKFSKLAHQWWDVNGEFRTLHHINPLRLKFIQSHINLKNKKIIDIGCGGGILAESMAQTGAAVTGLDLSPQLIETAKLLKDQGARSVHFLATHGLFVDDSQNKIQQSEVDSVLVSNSIQHASLVSKITELSVASLFAESLKHWL